VSMLVVAIVPGGEDRGTPSPSFVPLTFPVNQMTEQARPHHDQPFYQPGMRSQRCGRPDTNQ
jgi:hypothetical protein